MVMELFSVCLILAVGLCAGLSHESNCSSTYDASKGMIVLSEEEHGKTCVWKFTADQGETFVLEFIKFETLSQLYTLCQSTYLEIKDGATEDSPSLIGPKLCYIIQSSAKINTNTNGLWVKLVVDSFSFNVKLSAFVRIASDGKYYKTYTKSLTWVESHDWCQSEGGRLGTNYPVPTVDLEQAVFSSSSPVWTGKSITDWVWLLGCVKWDNVQGEQPVYNNSKYNQLSECAVACKGCSFFLVQGRSCYCLKDPTSIKKVELNECNITCRGRYSEKCGGLETYTHYQFRSLPIKSDNDGMKNCAALTKSGDHIPKSCDILLPFSCSFHNSTETYPFAMSWYEAVAFCRNQSGSFGLSTIPQLSADLYNEPMWLALIQSIDWGFPTAMPRKPEFSFVGAEGLLPGNQITYIEQLTNASNHFQFICEFDAPTCGSNLTTLVGNITSPNYPELYNNSNFCLWTISTDSPLVFIIEFESFDVEESDTCIYDYLQFREVKDNVKIISKKYCGKRKPDSFVARTNQLEVMFKADRSVVSQGFVLTWKLVDEDEAGRWEDRLKTGNQVNAGLVVGVTMTTTIVVIIVSCLILLVYRRKKIRMTVVNEPQGSSVNNAIYGISGSEFDSNSVVNDNYIDYENVSSPAKLNLKEEISYNYENVGNAIAVGKDVSKACGSKSNLVEMGTEAGNDNITAVVNMTKDKDNTRTEIASDKVNKNGKSGLDKIPVDQEVIYSKYGDCATGAKSVNDQCVLFDEENEKTKERSDDYAKPYKKEDKSIDKIYQNDVKGDNKDNDGIAPDEKMYQNEGKASGKEKDVVIGNYNYIYFENVDNPTDGYEEPIKSPQLVNFDKNQDHEPLVPKVSNWYTEIKETKQLKK